MAATRREIAESVLSARAKSSTSSEHPLEEKAALVLSANASYTVANNTLVVALELIKTFPTAQDLQDVNFSLKPMASIKPFEMAALLGADKIIPLPRKPLEHALGDTSEVAERDDEYYLPMVNFEFEGVQFLVPPWGFPDTSHQTTLILPKDNCIFTEEGVSAADFQGLMEYMYPLDSSDLTKDAWSSVLKLASRWYMTDYRKRALAKFEDESSVYLSPENMIVLGRSCGIPQWYRQGCIAFALGEPHFTSKHESTIGIDAMVKTARARDAAYRGDWLSYQLQSPEASYSSSTILSNLVQRETPRYYAGSNLVDEICTARANGLSGWLQHCYERLIEREESITLEEAASLGLDATISLWEARLHLFQHYRKVVGSMSWADDPDFTPHIEAEFADEFAEAQLLQSTFEPPPSPPVILRVPTKPHVSSLVLDSPADSARGLKGKKKKQRK